VCKQTFTKHEHSLFTLFISKNDYDKLKIKMILYNVKSKKKELKKIYNKKTKT
jgi:hypothetical protein